MKTTPSTPAQPEGPSTPVSERRRIERSRREVWPDAMREELRKVEFLAAVEVEEADHADWQAVFAAFERKGCKAL